VLGGHVHSERVSRVDGALLVRPGVNGHRLLEVELDEDGARVTRLDPSDAPRDERLVAALRSRLAETGLDEPVATVDEPLVRNEKTVFGGECRIGNFVADAYRWVADADVGLQNSGGIRTGPPLAGEVTLADLVSVLPFAEPVVVAEVTGEELLAIFRQAGATAADFGEPGWWHGHVSGARIVWDEGRARLIEAAVGGAPVEPTETYTVATAEYLLHSDHEFPALSERHRVGERDVQHEVLAAYAREFGVDAAIEGRIERRCTANQTATSGP
jgi:2',3'-cyclic-nucleotide 2'-phosphodiesterase (5'-nucleotidase family)